MIPCLLLAAAPACGHSAAPGGNGAVAWVDHAAPSYRPPPPRPVPYPASAAPCRRTQLRVTDGGGGAATGNVLQRFRFSNTGHATCLLRGFPTITGLAPSGQRVLLHARRSPGIFFGTLVPAVIAPGRHVYLDLGGEDVTCSLTRPVVYRDLAFRIPGGGTLPSHARLRRLCSGWDMSRFGLPRRTAATIPPRPGSLGTLRVSIQAPSSARAGTTLRYLVTLSNPTGTPVRLAPCPSYTEAIYDAPARPNVRSASFFLNCDTVHTIPPGRRVRYHMRIAVPARPHGPAKVGWHLNTPGEPAGATMIAIRSPQWSGSTPPSYVCTGPQLRLAYGPDITPKTGQHPRAVRLTNRGRACLLDGYPTIHVADASGNLLPFAVADSGDQMMTGAPPIRVRLPSGGHAWIALNKYRCDLGDHQVAAIQLQVRAGTGTATLSFPATDDWGYCGADDPGSIIHVSPFEPTLVRTLARH